MKDFSMENDLWVEFWASEALYDEEFNEMTKYCRMNSISFYCTERGRMVFTHVRNFHIQNLKELEKGEKIK